MTEPGTSTGSGGPDKDVKEKYREALERKKQSGAARGEGGGDHGGSKVHGAHSAASHRKEFRRKSGG